MTAASRHAQLLLALLAACAAAPGPRPLPQRQDPEQFEGCGDETGAAAYRLALVHLQAGRDAEALPLLREVVERCPDNVLAMAYYQDTAIGLGGDAAAAMRAYYARLPDDAGSPVPAFAKARLLESNFARKVAVDEVLRRHPSFAYGYLAQGRLLRSIGQLQDAAAGFERAIDRHPRLLAAHVELAEVLTELGRPAEAALAYENYLRGAPGDRATIRAYVRVALYDLGRADDARPWIERLLADDPHDELAQMDLAACDWRAGRLDRALQGYLAVLTRRPDNARAALNIGYLHYDAFGRDDDTRRAHWPRARKAFELFLQLVRPEDGYDYFEKVLAVPFRLKAIEELLGPGDGRTPVLDDLR
ncbi:MAG: tetratricopeptide repeat protein [Planctomycetota bacterium]